MTFEELGLGTSLLEAISYTGFEKPTPIQEQSIPHILKGNDVLACAQTGTGKTAAFVLPVLSKLAEGRSEHIDTLIIAPTRELAQQIDQQIQGFSYFVGASSYPVYGGGSGQDFDSQKQALEKGAEIIVATPGKLISHLNMGYVNLRHIRHFILDEADRMLDMGFFEDIMRISKFLPEERQTLLFSATMPPEIRKLAKSILKDPVEISISRSQPAEGILQAAYMLHDRQKIPFLKHLIEEKKGYDSILIFASTKKKVSDLARSLKNRDYTVEGISSDLDQKERENMLRLFRARKIRMLIATDILGRGIDIKDINLVINFDVPDDPEDYIHRIGRTARAASTGVAITFINKDDIRKFYRIERLLGSTVYKMSPPSEFGDGPAWTTSGGKGSGGKKGSFQKRGSKKR